MPDTLIAEPQSNSSIVEAFLGPEGLDVPDDGPAAVPEGEPVVDPVEIDPVAPIPPETPAAEPAPDSTQKIQLLSLGGREIDPATPEGREWIARCDENGRRWQGEAQRLEAQMKRGAPARDESGRFTSEVAPETISQELTASSVAQAREAVQSAHAADPFSEEFLEANLRYQEVLSDFKIQEASKRVAAMMPPPEAMERIRESVISPDEFQAADFVKETFESEVPIETIVGVTRNIMRDLQGAISSGTINQATGEPFSWADIKPAKLNKMIHAKSVEVFKKNSNGTPASNGNGNPTQVLEGQNGSGAIKPEGVSPGTPLKTPAPEPTRVLPTASARPGGGGVNGGKPPDQNTARVDTYKLVDAVLNRVHRG